MWDSFRNLFHLKVQHERLLAIWSSAHYGAALLAICVLCSLIRCSLALLTDNMDSSDCKSVPQLMAEFCCFLLFGITFYRFSIGDLRYLNWMGAAEESLREDERRRLKRDLIALIGRALVFTALAHSITEPSFFFLAFALLLLVDVPWLYVRHSECRKAAREDETLTALRLASCAHCAEALLRWLVNNTITLLVLTGLMISHFYLKEIDSVEFLRLSTLACLTNSVVDIVMTKWVYRPSLWR